MADESCTIAYDPEVPCVTMTWKGYVTSPRFRELTEAVLAKVEETGATKLLGDIVEFKLIGADDQKWLNESFVPRLIGAGVRHLAFVQTVFYFNRVAVQAVTDKVDPEVLIIQYFDNGPAARAWLKESGPEHRRAGEK